MERLLATFAFLFMLLGFTLETQAEQWIVQTNKPEKLADFQVEPLHGSPFYLVESSVTDVELKVIECTQCTNNSLQFMEMYLTN